MVKVVEIKGVLKALRRVAKERFDPGPKRDQPSAITGYTASYALWVHEIDKNYRNNKEWKYLERPARELANSGELSRIVRAAMRRRTKLGLALVLAALRIQRESQKLVPLDTGNLRGSAFTREE